jgi:hypothetical protein
MHQERVVEIIVIIEAVEFSEEVQFQTKRNVVDQLEICIKL